MKIIIIILQAILNLVRKRRDLIANRSKIPPEYRDDVVVWYSPKKQRLTNYDVIESYAEDFTKGSIETTHGEAIIDSQKQITITNILVLRRSIFSFVLKHTDFDLVLYIKGMTSDAQLRVAINLQNSLYEFINLHNGVNKIHIQNGYSFIIEGTVLGECNITITQLPTSILKDFSGNGLDAYMYGFQGKLNSGIGIYKFDFLSDLRINSAYFSYTERQDDKICSLVGHPAGWLFQFTSLSDIPAFKVEVKGIVNDNFTYRWYDENGNRGVEITINEDGIYELPMSHSVETNTGVGIVCTDLCRDNVCFTQIPDYPNSFCYAGKQYCQAYNVPKFTDYTIITRRAILTLNGSFGLISKRIIPANIGAFILEKDNNVTGAEPNTLRAFSFAVGTPVNPNLDYSITYQTKTKYKEQDLTAGGAGDSDVFLIGAGLYNEAINGAGEFITAVHDDIIILKRSLTINEINDITEAIFNETIIKE
jgi:hypothetical protein